MIEYVIRARKNQRGDGMLYTRSIANVKVKTLDMIVSEIEHFSTLSEADIKIALSAFQWVVLDYIRNGYSVRLGDLGSFRPTLTSRAGTTLDEGLSKEITGLNCRFTQSSGMRKALAADKIKFARQRVVKDAVNSQPAANGKNPDEEGI